MIHRISYERKAFLSSLFKSGEDWDRQNDKGRMRFLKPSAASLLWAMCLTLDIKKVLEIGTSAGYSTIWLSDAMEKNGGKVVSIEIDPSKHRLAIESIKSTQLESIAELVLADGKEYLLNCPDTFDLVFIDSWKEDYKEVCSLAIRLLDDNGLIVADNVISHEQKLHPFFDLIEQNSRLSSSIVEVGEGILIARKTRQ